MNRGLKFDDARLNLAAPSTHRTLVFLDGVDAGDDNPACAWQYPLHSPTQAPVVTGNDFYSITPFLIRLPTLQLLQSPTAPQEPARRFS